MAGWPAWGGSVTLSFNLLFDSPGTEDAAALGLTGGLTLLAPLQGRPAQPP